MKIAAPTESSKLSASIQEQCVNLLESQHNVRPKLCKELHESFVSQPLDAQLSEKYKSLHSQQPWILYWCCHARALLMKSPDATGRQVVGERLRKLQAKSGGFCGAESQDASVALSYAGVAAAMYSDYVCNRQAMLAFLRSVRDPIGVLRMHSDGEIDCRSVYCSVATAHMIGGVDEEMAARAAGFIVKCQNADGGFGGEAGGEAHAGYTWCALATLAIIGRLDLIDPYSALEWILARQCPLTGGCNGRPNKLIDTCYSFYVLASQIILTYSLKDRELRVGLIDEAGLRNYIVKCCQPCAVLEDKGGLCDKPGVKPDWYHTAYGLSALSLMRENCFDLSRTSPVLNVTLAEWTQYRQRLMTEADCSFGEGEANFHEWYTNEYLAPGGRV